MLNRVSSAYTSSPHTVGEHYRVLRKIGEGSFGVIFEGVHQVTGRRIAIKFESRKSEAPQLRDEFRSYQILSGCHGVPEVYYYGQDGLHNVLVLDLLGPSLEDLFSLCGRKFDVVTVANLAIQMISRVQSIHEKKLIYRDIKPDNFLVHTQFWKNKDVFIVDFGMAKQYIDSRTGSHIPYKERKSLSGTARYMSINTHLGREQSRRDDLEALGHVFMYFLRGQLPWQALKASTNKKKYEMIGKKKETTPIPDLCAGYPPQFATYLETVRGLDFEQTPDYDALRKLFEKVVKDQKGDPDHYQWLDNPAVQAEHSMKVLQERDPNRPTATPHQGSGKLAVGSYQPSPAVYGSSHRATSAANHTPSMPRVTNTNSNNPVNQPVIQETADYRPTFLQRMKNFFLCSGSS